MVSPVVPPRGPRLLPNHLPQPQIQRFRRTISSDVRLGDGTREGAGRRAAADACSAGKARVERHTRDSRLMSSILSDVHLAYHVLGRLVAKDLEEAAVSMSEALVLRVATINPRVTAQGLLVTTGLPPSTLSSLLTRLEERQYMRRFRLEGDRRYAIVRPTRVGATVGRMVESSLTEIEERLGEQVTPAERAGLTVLAEGLFAVERPETASRLG